MVAAPPGVFVVVADEVDGKSFVNDGPPPDDDLETMAVGVVVLLILGPILLVPDRVGAGR